MSHPQSEPNPDPTAPAREAPEEDRTPSTITVIDTQSFHPPETPHPTKRPGEDSSVISTNSSSSARYEIRKVLGTGGFGTVSLAWDSTLHREVAIKRPATNLSAEIKQTFLAEARLAAKVKHPGIVVVHDVGVDQTGDPFVVYEYLAGANLKQRMASERYSLQAALELTLALAEALAAAHQQGLTHRDLKPANVLIDEQGKPHIADFGLATEHEEQGDLRGQVAGTNRYMSPEQVRGESHHLDGRTDLWSLGVILYELLTGHTPFPGKQQEVFDQILSREPRPPRQWLSSIPKPVEDIVLKLLSKPVALRYASAGDVVEDLQVVLAKLPKSATDLVNDAESRSSDVSVNRWQMPKSWVAGFVVLVLVGVGLAYAAQTYFSLPGPGQLNNNNSENAKRTQRLPPTEQDFVPGAWTDLLAQEPWEILFTRENSRHFESGHLSVDAKYQVLLQAGAVAAPDFSLRATLKSGSWNGESGLFLGFSAEPNEDADRATLVGVTRLPNGKTVVQPRTMQLQRRGLQYPNRFVTATLGELGTVLAPNSPATIQIDVRKRIITAIHLNSQMIPLTGAPEIRTFPTQGKFGVYVFEQQSNFVDLEIRLTP